MCSSAEVNSCHTQLVDRRGVVFGGKQPCSLLILQMLSYVLKKERNKQTNHTVFIFLTLKLTVMWKKVYWCQNTFPQYSASTHRPTPVGAMVMLGITIPHCALFLTEQSNLKAALNALELSTWTAPPVSILIPSSHFPSFTGNYTTVPYSPTSSSTYYWLYHHYPTQWTPENVTFPTKSTPKNCYPLYNPSYYTPGCNLLLLNDARNVTSTPPQDDTRRYHLFPVALIPQGPGSLSVTPETYIYIITLFHHFLFLCVTFTPIYFLCSAVSLPRSPKASEPRPWCLINERNYNLFCHVC